MDIAKDLALIDQLCARDFPSEHERYHIAWLGPGDWPDVSDCYAYEAALVERFTQRWGEAARWGTVTLEERIARGEEIPEPWALLTDLAIDVRTWEVSDSIRRVTLAVADREDENRPRIWAAVTETAPP
ncbi:hypothetical protein [Streptomyces justiciae]|uniref:hypothetical protein n=1 Tax=Streptomyces justiciae TaxID=2780140 RepID=UPI001882FC6D|nr:hypothetical protein [Streptomyces justiciae]MBE8470797.1 hypothetical protein [Streptomyces justiciae]MCW8378532.1 hypothetical protein [Streptomyces justiciae]